MGLEPLPTNSGVIDINLEFLLTLKPCAWYII